MNIRYLAGFTICAGCISLIMGVLANVSIGVLFLRILLSVVFSLLLYFLIHKVFNTYLAKESNTEQIYGGNIDVVIDDKTDSLTQDANLYEEAAENDTDGTYNTEEDTEDVTSSGELEEELHKSEGKMRREDPAIMASAIRTVLERDKERRELHA